MPAVSALARELRRAEAAELARAGDHDAAVRILEGLDGDDPATLDLLAKVHAQRGDLDAAASAWQRVLARSPEDPAALAGTQLIAEITAGKRRGRPLPVRSAGAVAAVAVVLAGVFVLVPDSPPDSVPSAEPAPSSPRVVTETVPAADRSEQEAARLHARLRALMGELAGPGVRLEQRERDVRVIFDQGLFPPDGSELTADGRRELVAWGQRLRGKELRVTVLGHGVVVDGGPTTGGSAVAVARAATAAQTLAEVAGRPLTSFTVMAAEQSASPHTGADARPRNRTVTLLVAPA